MNEHCCDCCGHTHGDLEAYEKIDQLKLFIAIVLCWKPAWAQTSYFQDLSERLRNDLIELAKSTKDEGSGGIDNEWLDALKENDATATDTQNQ